jgi:outer membrane protein TolC|tara:strand:+ start:14535 stop:17366 length:2832 start_codon:yes stop_codon:yes gene_type:complete
VLRKIELSILFIFITFNLLFANSSNNNESVKVEVTAKKFLEKTKGMERISGKDVGKTAIVSKPIEKSLKKIFGEETTTDVKKYEKVTLIDVVLETISNNYKVKVAREKVRQAQIDLDTAYSGYKPTVDLEYSNARTKLDPSDDGPNSDANKYNDETIKLQLKQNLYAGGATEYKIKGLKKSLEVAKNRYELSIATEIQNAIKAYMGVVFSHQSLLVTESNMKSLKRILEIVTTKYNLGAATIGDLNSIKASVSNAETKLSKTNSKFVEALKYYEYIAGEKFKDTLPYEYNFKIKVGELEKLIEESFENNLNIVSYRLTIESERNKLKSAQASFKPKVDFELSRTRIFNKDTLPEDFYIQNRTSAMIKVKYNLYNGDKDYNKVLSVYSTIREVRYKIEEEKRKLKWIISNLHQSLHSQDDSIQSTIDEVESSDVTVESYWEAFKNGEQDLLTLLTAQRQLNTAQVSLIESYQNRLNDYYKLLFESGALVAHFQLDPTKDNFIDFTKSNYKKKNSALSAEQVDLMEFAKRKEKKEKQVAIQKVDTLEDILKFKDKFLDTDDDYFTIYIGKFKSIYDTFNYIKSNKFSKQSFMVDELENYKFKNVLAYGIFETKKDANTALDSLKKDENKKYKVVSIGKVKNLYKTYIDGYDELKPKELVETRTIKMVPKAPSEYFTNKEFKDKFLLANEDYYTINLATLSNLDSVVRLVERENLYDNSFIFRYGPKKEWIKIVYGVYDSYEKAELALASLSNDLKDKYFPIIEGIKNKQELFKKYSDLTLGTPSFSTKKGEFVKLSEETKTQLRDAKTKEVIQKRVQDKVLNNKEKKLEDKIPSKEEVDKKVEDKTSENEQKKEKEVIDNLKPKIDKEKPSSEKYTLTAVKIKKDKVNWFLNRYEVKDYNIKDLENGEVEINLGTFESKESALKALNKYHPFIQSSAKIVKIGKE